MDSRKRVRLDIGAKRPFVPATKKHRCLRFARDQAAGFVEKMTTSQIQNLISRDATSIVRLLGPEVQSNLIDSPTSVIAKVEDENNFLSKLNKLETTVDRLNSEIVALKEREIALKEREVGVALIVNEGYSVCTHAFGDYVVNSFYKAAGNPVDRRGWLDGKEALNFVQRGGFMHLFDRHVKIDHNLLLVVQKLRSMSVKYNKTNCHIFKPVQVAFAFKQLEEFKPEDPIVKFFHTCFGVPVESVMKLHNTGKLPAKYFKEYSVAT